MVKYWGWLMLTVLSGGAITSFSLHQQYEAKSADFRILYRDVTIKLSQHDAIMPLLPASQYRGRVQKMFPQILYWHPRSGAPPQTIDVQEEGRYWLHADNQSLLIDLPRLIGELAEKNVFSYLAIVWKGRPLVEVGTPDTGCYWQWHKVIASQTQPFTLSVADSPDWLALPWPVILSPALLWGLVFYLTARFNANRRRLYVDRMRAHHVELTRLNTMGELTAGIVHELNQPLTAILSYNQAALRLLQQQHTDTLPQLLGSAVVQIKRADSLLQQFRQKLNSEQVVWELVVLSQLWARVLMLLDNEPGRSRVKVSSRIASNLPALFAPSLWLEQILLNIVNNALQAQRDNAPGSAWIRLEASAVDNGLALTLTDGGPGLSDQALRQVFMPFFTTRPNGIGLGLTLTDTLVQRLNGTIEVSNIAGQGACFRLWLPVNAQERK